MATTKVSELAALTTPDGAEELLINDGGTSKKITIANAIIAGTGITKSGATISAAPVALTTIQTAANQSAHLALTAQEGDVVVRSDENKTYMHNGGSAGSMSDYTLMATPTDAVTSVAGNTGVVTNAHIAAAVEAASDSNTFTDADHSKLNAIEASATADQTDAEIRAAVEAASDSNVFTDADHTKLNAIEASADVTDTTNVTAAGALMDSEVTNLAAVKSFAASDYATAAQGTTADAALPKAGGTMTGDLNFGDDVDANFGGSSDLKIYHDGSNSYIKEQGTGNLDITSNGTNISIMGKAGENSIIATGDGSVELYHDNSKKFETTANGITVTGTAIATTDTDTSNSGTVDLDFAAKQNFVLTLTGNITSLTASNEQVGQSGFIVFIQDGTGGRTVSLHGDYETAAGAGLTLTSTASATDIVPYVVAASSRILLGTPQLAFS